MKSDQEYIAFPAVWYDDKRKHHFQNVYGIDTGFVIGCFRHPLCPFPTNFHYIPSDGELGYPCDVECEVNQGFVTSHGRFVDRKEAAQIALDRGQVESLKSNMLYSEDLFEHQTFRATANNINT